MNNSKNKCEVGKIFVLAMEHVDRTKEADSFDWKFHIAQLEKVSTFTLLFSHAETAACTPADRLPNGVLETFSDWVTTNNSKGTVTQSCSVECEK